MINPVLVGSQPQESSSVTSGKHAQSEVKVASPGGNAANGKPDAPQILLVEDNLINQRLGLVQLKWLGYIGEIAATGQAAIQAVAKTQYRLVLMDCQMPDMDGLEATRLIRSAEIGTGRHVPIVALTASGLPEDRNACVAAGMDGFLAKPIDIDQLGDMITHWMRK